MAGGSGLVAKRFGSQHGWFYGAKSDQTWNHVIDLLQAADFLSLEIPHRTDIITVVDGPEDDIYVWRCSRVFGIRIGPRDYDQSSKAFKSFRQLREGLTDVAKDTIWTPSSNAPNDVTYHDVMRAVLK